MSPYLVGQLLSMIAHVVTMRDIYMPSTCIGSLGSPCLGAMSFHLFTIALAIVVDAALTVGTVSVAKGLEAAALATALLGTILPGGFNGIAPEVKLLPRAGEVGGIDSSWREVPNDDAKSLLELQSWNHLSELDTSRDASSSTSRMDALLGDSR